MRLVACGGVDPSGGAGLDADRDAAAVLGAQFHGVATCRTDQDDAAVRAVTPVDGWWDEVLPDGALKFGLLPRPEDIRAAAALVRPGTVVDPVMASSSGYAFWDEACVEAFRGVLLPAGPVVTPNLPEAAALVGEQDPERAAARLLELGAAAVVIKGGHGEGAAVRELAWSRDGDPAWLEHPRLPGTLRGTGCRFASALALELARGAALPIACERASALVGRLLAGER